MLHPSMPMVVMLRHSLAAQRASCSGKNAGKSGTQTRNISMVRPEPWPEKVLDGSEQCLRTPCQQLLTSGARLGCCHPWSTIIHVWPGAGRCVQCGGPRLLWTGPWLLEHNHLEEKRAEGIKAHHTHPILMHDQCCTLQCPWL